MPHLCRAGSSCAGALSRSVVRASRLVQTMVPLGTYAACAAWAQLGGWEVLAAPRSHENPETVIGHRCSMPLALMNPCHRANAARLARHPSLGSSCDRARRQCTPLENIRPADAPRAETHLALPPRDHRERATLVQSTGVAFPARATSRCTACCIGQS